MVFGISVRKTKKRAPSRSKGSKRPTARSKEADKGKDPSRSSAGGRRGSTSRKPSFKESLSSSSKSMRGARGTPKHSASAGPSAYRGGSESSSIRVTVRFRPLSGKERNKGDTAVWDVDADNNVGRYIKGNFSPKYRYDTVFTDDLDNQYVYQAVGAEVVETALSGVNGTIFAYGVTSSGKTHTMMGGKGELGLIPRSMQHVFDLIEQNPDKEYLLKLSMLELYNEELNDLLDPRRRNMKVREDRTQGVHVDGLTEVVLESAEQALCLINTGIENRKVSATTYNEGSSRSHTLCRISVEVNDKGAGRGGRTFSYLNLIDLAGSESAKAAKSKGHRMEGSFINKSLLTLGTVIHKLSEAKKKTHIPFRDSKLTRLLQSSLTGNGSKMAIICCVTPSSSQAEETENTLKFAERAKKVKIKRSKNEMSDSRSEIAALQRVIVELKQQLKEMTEKAATPQIVAQPDPALQEELARMKERLEEELHARMKREEDRLALQAKINSLTRLILHSTRAQTGNMLPKSTLRRSHSFDALKAKSAIESSARRSLETVVIHNEMPMLPPELTEIESISKKIEASLDPVNIQPLSLEMRRTSISDPKIRSPSATSLAVPGNIPEGELVSEMIYLKEQLNLARQTVAEREKELIIRNRESVELRRRLASYENTNPPTARSNASEDEANVQSLEYSLLEADRGILEESLLTAKRERERLTNELLSTKIELKRTKKRLSEFEGTATTGPQVQLFRTEANTTYNIPESPTCSVSTTETGVSDLSPGRHSEERPPRPPVQSGEMNVELRNKLERLEAEVRCALQALTAKDNQIESQRTELESQKEESEQIKQLLRKLGSENEGLKQRIKMLEAQQSRMQGYQLDTIPTNDLLVLKAEIKDASHRLERAAYSRRISSIPALSFDELDTDATQDIYVSKGLESIED